MRNSRKCSGSTPKALAEPGDHVVRGHRPVPVHDVVQVAGRELRLLGQGPVGESCLVHQPLDRGAEGLLAVSASFRHHGPPTLFASSVICTRSSLPADRSRTSTAASSRVLRPTVILHRATEQVGVRELLPRALVAVVQQHREALRLQRGRCLGGACGDLVAAGVERDHFARRTAPAPPARRSRSRRGPARLRPRSPGPARSRSCPSRAAVLCPSSSRKVAPSGSEKRVSSLKMCPTSIAVWKRSAPPQRGQRVAFQRPAQVGEARLEVAAVLRRRGGESRCGWRLRRTGPRASVSSATISPGKPTGPIEPGSAPNACRISSSVDGRTSARRAAASFASSSWSSPRISARTTVPSRFVTGIAFDVAARVDPEQRRRARRSSSRRASRSPRERPGEPGTPARAGHPARSRGRRHSRRART